MIKTFEYLKPGTVEEAVKLLSKYRDEKAILAGGQSLLILMKFGLAGPKYLVDIKGLSSLDYVRPNFGQGVSIGVLTTHRKIEKSPFIREKFSVLSDMEQELATVETRCWGTIGGNLCHSDPTGDVFPVLIALNASLRLASVRGERILAAEEFSTGYFDNVLQDDEMLLEINIPEPKPHTGTAYTKFSMIKGDNALVSAAVSMTVNASGDKCEDVRIVLGAAAPTPMRAKGAEGVLRGKKITDDLHKKAGQRASEEARPVSEIHGSEAYKRHLAKALVERVAREALERARNV